MKAKLLIGLLFAFIVATGAALAVSMRYRVESTKDGKVYRLNVWTGKVWELQPGGGSERVWKPILEPEETYSYRQAQEEKQVEDQLRKRGILPQASPAAEQSSGFYQLPEEARRIVERDLERQREVERKAAATPSARP